MGISEKNRIPREIPQISLYTLPWDGNAAKREKIRFAASRAGGLRVISPGKKRSFRYFADTPEL